MKIKRGYWSQDDWSPDDWSRIIGREDDWSLGLLVAGIIRRWKIRRGDEPSVYILKKKWRYIQNTAALHPKAFHVERRTVVSSKKWSLCPRMRKTFFPTKEVCTTLDKLPKDVPLWRRMY